MTDVSNLDDLANAIASSSAKIKAYAKAQAAASQSQELDIQSRAKQSALDALAVRVAALETPAPPPPPPPPPPPTGQAIPSNGIITSGGTYTGTFTGQLTIQTTEPVIVNGAKLTNLTGQIVASGVNGIDLTLDHCTVTGGKERFVAVENAKNLVIRNNTIEKTSGINIIWGTGTVLITKNKHHNIQTPTGGNYGNFVQFRECQNVAIEVSWNEILNEYNLSLAEDLISVFKSAHLYIHDNYFQHQSNPGNAGGSSQNPITIECGNTPTAGLESHDVRVINNQIIDAVGGVGVFPGCYDVTVNGNRIVQDGFLPDGVTRIANGYRGMSIQDGTSNCGASGNVVGYVNKDGSRNDWYFTAGSDKGGNAHMPDPVTRAIELAERDRWNTKVAAAGITLGAG